MVKFRATPPEKERIEQLAKKLGISMTKLILMAVLEGHPPSIRRVDPALLRHLSTIGNNLNQVARACNYRAKVGDPIDGIALLIVLRRILDEIRNYAVNNDTDR